MGVVFLTLLAAGLLLVLATCRMDQVAWNFVRLITLLALTELSLAVAAYIGLSGGAIRRPAVVAAIFSFVSGGCAFLAMGLSPVVAKYARAVRLLCVLGGLLALAAVVCWNIDAGAFPARTPGGRTFQVLVYAASAILLGSVSLAMLLGHAYLTHTEMTIQPLRRLANLFAGAMILRTLLAVAAGAYGLHLVRQGGLAPEAVRSEQLVVAIRYLIGLIVPGIFCYMVWKTVRLRATQSATGILYFGLVLIYLGELAAMQLTRELGIAF